MMNARKIELLAPAKDYLCGIEAVKHGADAVYIGAPKFSARSAAGNTIADIENLCKHAHLYGVKVYVALNTLIKEEELEEVKLLAWKLYHIGVDALIVQDMAMMKLELPPIPLHASTQTDNRTPKKVQFLQEVGFTQVVLARELSLSEVKDIASKSNVLLEAFVHGALCVSYSGQCYISEALCKRSANRGACAQYCRLPYSMTDADGKIILQDKHLLSLKDMNRSEQLEQMIDAGISSLKIEGRLKDSNYVKNITAYYRQEIDKILNRRSEYIRASQGISSYTFIPTPEKSFNRGFTPFMLDGKKNDISAFDTPKSLGENIGTVKTISKNSITIAGQKTLNNGDGLSFFNQKGVLEGFRINRVEENRIFPFDMPTISPKTTLYRNFDQAFEKILSKPTAERILSLEFELWDTSSGLALQVQSECGARIMLHKSIELKVAQKPQEDNIITQLSKLGNTPFTAKQIKLNLSKEWFIASSILADMRRSAIELIQSAIKIRYNRDIVPRITSNTQYPEQNLSYLANVANSHAKAFYKQHGVNSISPAFEIKAENNVPLMFSKHCLLYAINECPKQNKQQTTKNYKQPYYLVHKDMRLRLEFDCKKCIMLIYQTQQ